jgi:hypothetical protein
MQQHVGQALLSAACHCSCNQLPAAAKLAQSLSGPILQHVRGIAQAARKMEPEFEPPTGISLLSIGTAVPTEPQQDVQLADAVQDYAHALRTVGPAAAAQLHAPQPAQQQQQLAVPQMVQAHQPPSPTGVKKTFYKRKLPTPPATEFSSAEGVLPSRAGSEVNVALAAAARHSRSLRHRHWPH